MWIPREKPDYLYKYCSAERAAQITRDLSFYFAPAAQLNDLFEFRARSLYQEDSDTKYRIFAKRLVVDGWWSNFDEALEALKSTTPMDAMETTYSDVMQDLNAKLLSIMKHSGVTCFTSHRNNQRMWGTYGNTHAGAVLEFSTSSEHSQFASFLMPVIYTASKLGICPSELITERMTFDQRAINLFLCVKHLHWKEENEWRLLLLADHEQKPADRVIRFERKALTRVFLGPLISEGNESLIRGVASLHNPAVPVFKRKIDDELASEDFVGFEQIHSFDQLKYWALGREQH